MKNITQVKIVGKNLVELAGYIHKKDGLPWIIGVHGIGEHAGRHQHLIEELGDKFSICLFDLRGHGRSSGKRTQVDVFEDYLDDLSLVIDYLKNEEKMDEFRLYGHSMGALITCGFVQEAKKYGVEPLQTFVSAPPISYPGFKGILDIFISRWSLEKLQKLPISIPVGGIVDLNGLSHRSDIAKEYESDPLNQTKSQSRLILELARFSKKVFSRPIRPNGDFNVVCGSQDPVVSAKAVEEYFSLVEKAAQVNIIPGGYHELHFEIEKFRRPYIQYLKSSFSLS